MRNKVLLAVLAVLAVLSVLSVAPVARGGPPPRTDIGDQFPPLSLTDIGEDGWVFTAVHEDGTTDTVAGDWSMDGARVFAEIADDIGDQFPPVATTLTERRRMCRESGIRECCGLAPTAPLTVCACFRSSHLRRSHNGVWECLKTCC